MVTEEKLTGRRLDFAVMDKIFGNVVLCDDYETAPEWRREQVSQPRKWHPRDSHPPNTTCGHCDDLIPFYSSDCAATKEVEDRINELGLWHEYASALLEATGTQYQSSLPVIVWAIVRATPEERCRAALKAMNNA